MELFDDEEFRVGAFLLTREPDVRFKKIRGVPLLPVCSHHVNLPSERGAVVLMAVLHRKLLTEAAVATQQCSNKASSKCTAAVHCLN